MKLNINDMLSQTLTLMSNLKTQMKVLMASQKPTKAQTHYRT